MSQLLHKNNQLSRSNDNNALRKGVALWQHEGMTRPTFARNLQIQMETHGLNQPELAYRVRVGTPTVNRWINEGRIPEGPILLAVAKVLEIDPWLLLGSDYVEPRPPREAPRVGRPPASAAQSLERAVKSALDRHPERSDKKPTSKESRLTGAMMRAVVDEPPPDPDFDTRPRLPAVRKRDRA